jgi:hypothetical protein
VGREEAEEQREEEEARFDVPRDESVEQTPMQTKFDQNKIAVSAPHERESHSSRLTS